MRITTFYDEQDVAKALLGVLHETGHALYERGLPAAFARQPVGQAAGMAAHESQSLIVEMQACRSDAFLAFLGAGLRRAFGVPAAAAAPANLARRLLGRPPVGRWSLHFRRNPSQFSVAKAMRVLGYRPGVDLAEGMRRTEAWLRAEGYLQR